MVARLVRDPFDREGWFFELKWDGFRAVAETDGAGSVKLYSRRHNQEAIPTNCRLLLSSDFDLYGLPAMILSA